MSRHIIVGDVHGCIDELNILIDAVGILPEDTWVFAGDLVDKGPDSAGVVKRVRALSAETNVVSLRGNHELNHEKYLRALAASEKYGTAIKIPQRKLDVIVPIQDALSDEDREFLLAGPLYHHIPEHGVLVVHAGVLPTTPELPPWEDFGSLSQGEQKAAELHVTRGRFVRGEEQVVLKLTARTSSGSVDLEELDVISVTDLPPDLVLEVNKSHVLPAGEFISLGKEENGDKFWAEIYDGRMGHVYFGHQPFLREDPVFFPHATGLDLGCVHGNRLAAAILGDTDGCNIEPGEKCVKVVTVTAQNQYARPLNSNWLPKVPGFTGKQDETHD